MLFAGYGQAKCFAFTFTALHFFLISIIILLAWQGVAPGCCRFWTAVVFKLTAYSFVWSRVDIAAVIHELTEEKGLDREKVIEIICKGILSAFKKKFPHLGLEVDFNKKTSQVEVFVVKKVVETVSDQTHEILLKQAQTYDPDAQLDFKVRIPLDQKIGRIEINSAKGVIAGGIRALEEESIYNQYIGKQGALISGTINKKERAGFAINLGEHIAFMPNSCAGGTEDLRVGFTVRALLKEVLPSARGGYQLILDRSSAEFLKKLLETEVPEVFDGTVEVKKIERIPGYKSKVAVFCSKHEIDPVGTCVGVGGSRIKPILKELGGFEKIDLVAWSDNLSELVVESLKPAKISRVSVDQEAGVATVWVDEEQRSVAIGRMGQNIALASQLVGLKINLSRSDESW